MSRGIDTVGNDSLRGQRLYSHTQIFNFQTAIPASTSVGIVGGACMSITGQNKNHARAFARMRYIHQCCNVGWKARAFRPPCNQQLCPFIIYLMSCKPKPAFQFQPLCFLSLQPCLIPCASFSPTRSRICTKAYTLCRRSELLALLFNHMHWFFSSSTCM